MSKPDRPRILPRILRPRIRRGPTSSGSADRRAWLPVLALVLVIVAGCGEQRDARVRAYRERFLLETRPAEALSPAEAREKLRESEPVVLLGRVRFPEAAGDSENRAMFVLNELSDHDEQAGHDAANCPFCKRRAAKSIKAAVQFVDERGEVLPFSAERLFGLRDGDVVVVQGRGQWSEPLNLLSVTADGMFVEKTTDP